MSGVPLDTDEVDAALKESRGASGVPLCGPGGVSEDELLRVRATVERVNRLIDHVADLKAIIAKNHNRDLELMRQRDEALLAPIDARNLHKCAERIAFATMALASSRGRFGHLVRVERAMAGLTFRRLAKASGLSVGYLSDIERGARLATAETAARIAAAIKKARGE